MSEHTRGRHRNPWRFRPSAWLGTAAALLLLLLQSCCSTRGPAEKKAEEEPARTSAAEEQADLGAGPSWTEHRLVVDGLERSYFLYIPSGHREGETLPGVIAFHGFDSDAGGIRWLTQMDRWLEEFRYILVAPNAIAKSWNVGKGFGRKAQDVDDLAFMEALVRKLRAEHPIDPRRLYAMGFSNGAQMVPLMTCNLRSSIAAGAMVAHTLNIPCQLPRPVPMAIVHGAKDPMAPFDGGGEHALASHAYTVDFFRQANGALTAEEKVVDLPTIRCTAYTAEAGAGEVLDCVGYEDGHTWPGARDFMPELFGKTNREVDANQLFFQFFARHALPAKEPETPAPSTRVANTSWPEF